MISNNKLIRAGDLLKAVCEDTSIRGSAFAAIRRHIDAAPAVEAEEVVRCKDCKHYVAPQGTYVCDCFEGLNFATDNNFCSYGERREGE